MNELDEIHDHNINVKNRIIYLHQVDIEDSVSFKTIPGLVKNLDYLNSEGKGAIVLRMVSVDGGCVSHGLAAYSAIKNSKSKVNIECTGLTASCGTIILQAGHTRAVSRDGSYMVHFGSISLSTDVTAAQSILANNALWKSQMLKIYAERCIDGKFFKDRKYSLNRTKGYLNTKFKNHGDLYLDAEEFLNYGFCDKII